MSNSFTRAIDAIDEQSNVPGIQNLGNTCYLSASLQTLFSIPDFLRELYESYVTELAKQKEMPLTKALLEVAVAIGVLSEESTPKISSENAQSKLLSSKAANPTALKKQMDVLTDKFVGYEQRDAHEFLSDLVDFLHDELIASSEYGETKIEAADGLEIGELKSGDSTEENATKEISGEEKKSSNLPPTDEYFRLTVRVRLTCDSCKYSR
jgi:ubiquitin C-terminal hydrolase